MNFIIQDKLKIGNILPYIGFIFFILSVKLIVISIYGNATPYWDQWDAEADKLYRPLLEGTLTWTDLLSAHNEHRIFTTRLLAIILLYLNNGIWNPILQMQVNAFVHATSLAILVFYTAQSISKNQRNLLIVFCSFIFAIPFGWENTLAGFQSQFYFLLGFSFLFLWAVAAYKTYSTKWWLGIIAGILSLVSLASGAITILAGILILIFRKLIIKDKDVAVTAIFILTLIASIAIISTPAVPGHAPLKAQSISQFLIALINIFSWPNYKVGIGIIVLHAPVLLLCFRILRNQDYRSPPLLFIGAVILWLLGQFISIAYGRAVDVTSSRYLDLFAIGLVVNFASLAILFNKSKSKVLFIGYWAFWITTVIFGFASSANKLNQDLQLRLSTSLEQEKNLRSYLCSNDMSYLQNKPYLHIPYPNADRLKGLLDNPTIRSILPRNIYNLNTNYPITPDGQPFCDPGKLIRPFEIIKSDEINQKDFLTTQAIKQNGWLGSDYLKSTLPNFQIIGSLIHSENDTGMITLQVNRGDRVLYKSGPRVEDQFILINGGGEGKFYTTLPLASEWTVLHFSNENLPDTFDVTFLDVGTKWGEWSAIAVAK